MSKEVSISEDSKRPEDRFALSIANQFKSIAGIETPLNHDQMMLAKKYFIGIDRALARAQASKRTNMPDVNWKSIKMETIPTDMVDNILAGLDPTAANHINFIPFFDNKEKKYNLNQIVGYVGLEVRHSNQGLHKIDSLITRLVYSNETFIPKYSNGIEQDSFIHKAENPFERGEVIGGYIFKKYANGNTNLRVVTLADIEKRKPKYASAEFWGGEKDQWANGQKTGKKEKVEGWFDEMAIKTIRRMAFLSEPLDPLKTTPKVSTFESFDDDNSFDDHSSYEVVDDIPKVEIPIVKIPAEVEKPKVKAGNLEGKEKEGYGVEF